MTDHSYTHMEDVPVVVCNDCGASAFSEERVQHYDSCKPGECERWTEHYNQALDEEALDKVYKEYSDD